MNTPRNFPTVLLSIAIPLTLLATAAPASANHTCATATNLHTVGVGEAGVKLGSLSSQGDAAYYSTSAGAAETLVLALHSPPGVNFDLYVLDEDCENVQASSTSGGSAMEIIDFRPSADGTYKVKVHGFGGGGDFRLEWAKLPMDTPVVKEEITVVHGVTL